MQCGFGDFEDFGGFGVGGSAERDEFQGTDFARVDAFELVECELEFEDSHIGRRHGGEVFERDALAAIALLTASSACVIDEDAAHGSRGNREKVLAAFADELRRRTQLQEGFVDEGGGLEGVTGALAVEVRAGDGSELGVEHLGYLIQGRSISPLPVFKQGGDGRSR
jgi:hypothetical protein